MEIEFLRVFPRNLHGPAAVNKHPGPSRNHPQHHVLRHGKAGHQHEVLVDHADALGDGDGGGGESDLLAVDPNLAACGLFQAKQHLHQRRFSRAVFSHQRVDFSFADVQIDVLIGGDAIGIHFCNPLHLDDVFLCHIWDSPSCVFCRLKLMGQAATGRHPTHAYGERRTASHTPGRERQRGGICPLFAKKREVYGRTDSRRAMAPSLSSMAEGTVTEPLMMLCCAASTAAFVLSEA
ncbi:hypothetical protein SDC9_117185 [bioreactor metagenome]|uniref:Uncharacterized protein n=1 Tax=bioreactor metagenome TaxID=1076179 RepID=A0A645BY30_9ZZZZ